MKTYDIPILFRMKDCQWFDDEEKYEKGGVPTILTAQVDLSEDEVRQLQELVHCNNGERDAARLNLKQVFPDIYRKMNDAAKLVCDKASYRYALINEFINNEAHYDADTLKVMEAVKADGLFEFDPDNISCDDKLPDDEKEIAEYSIWAEEYFFDLNEEQMVEFIEKYYGYTAGRVTNEKRAYEYSVMVPEGIGQ